MGNRTKHQILKSILEGIQTPKTKTDIMYENKLSYAQLVQYLKYLLENEFYDYDADHARYTISDRGKTMLKRLKDLPQIDF